MVHVMDKTRGEIHGNWMIYVESRVWLHETSVCMALNLPLKKHYDPVKFKLKFY